MNKHRFIKKVKKLAASCDPSTPERIFAVTMYGIVRARSLGLPSTMTADPELVTRPRPDQEDAPADVTSLAQAQEIFETLFSNFIAE